MTRPTYVLLANALLVGTAWAGPSAVEGTFRDRGRTLTVRATKKTYAISLGVAQGTATLAKQVLHVTWTAKRAKQSKRGIAGVVAGEQTKPGTTAKQTQPPSPALPRRLPLGADRGRLTIRVGKRVFHRVESGDWWKLPRAVRRSLIGPFQNLHLRAWKKAPFQTFYAAKYAGTPVSRRAALAEFSFTRLKRPERIGLLCLNAKMRADRVWWLVGPLEHIGGDGVLLFQPLRGQAHLKRALRKRGFGDYWFASRGRPWGYRSRWRGVQLHFRGGSIVNVHIDFINPGDPPGRVTNAWQEMGLALAHRKVDLQGWSKNHTPTRVLREVRAAGYVVPLP